MTIALGIGVYLTATTVLIAKDGALYIERAQQLESNPVKITKKHPPGYPFLILLAHKCAALFTDDSSVFTWIYSAQSVTLLCRLLALIPLYFIGKLLVGGKNSFWAVLILIFLPFPAQFVCDVVREWPYLLFLATGFFFLLWGAKYGKWWAFGLVGLSSGLGYLIRHEAAQLVVYGFLWIAISMFIPKLWNVSRWKNLFALALLLIGFAIPATPYMKCTGKIIPHKLNNVIKSFSFNASPEKTETTTDLAFASGCNTAEIIPSNVLNAFGKLAQQISENLMHFFVLPLVIGLFSHFRKLRKILFTETFFIFCLVVVYTTMMVLLHINHGYISRRHCMPIVVFTIFYIPVGLRIIEGWLDKKGSHDKQKNNIKKKQLSWFVILFLIGTGICLPKLFRPLRANKQGYRDAAKWLSENTAAVDSIAVFDRRIAFYAERKGMIYETTIPKQAKYIVRIVKDEDQRPKLDKPSVKSYSGWVDKRKKKKRIVIYKAI